MTDLAALEAEADRRRQAFADSLRRFKPKLTPLGLADEALRRLDPQAEAVAATGRTLRRNPLPVIPLLLGFGWLMLEARKPVKAARPKRASLKRKKRPLITSQEKE
ncbi:MAG: hypothetical protein ACOZAM_23065 [Pseudomonadota bacterium]